MVAPALAAAIVAGMMFAASSAAAAASSASAASHGVLVALGASTRSSASIRSRSTSGSGVRMPPSAPAVSGESSVSVKLFWPITFCSPRSIRPTRSRWDSTRRAFM